MYWLQPPYSAASCSQLLKGKLYISVECCSILAAAKGYEFDVFPYRSGLIIKRKLGLVVGQPGCCAIINFACIQYHLKKDEGSERQGLYEYSQGSGHSFRRAQMAYMSQNEA